MIKSETGSGKTLAYLIPIVQILQSLPTKIDRTSGVYCVILVPTRELCVQIEETIKKLLLPFFWIVPTVICGGQKRKAEKSRLRKGANIIISTPGRLLDHVLHTTSLSLKCVKLLVLDEADRLLDMGFEQQLRDLFNLLQQQTTERVQTILLSATLSQEIQQLATNLLPSSILISCGRNPILVKMLHYWVSPLETMKLSPRIKCPNSFVSITFKSRAICVFLLSVPSFVRSYEV